MSLFNGEIKGLKYQATGDKWKDGLLAFAFGSGSKLSKD